MPTDTKKNVATHATLKYTARAVKMRDSYIISGSGVFSEVLLEHAVPPSCLCSFTASRRIPDS